MISLPESYRYAERLTRAKARNFFYAFWFLPPERRRSISTVYAFSRRADDAVDAVEEAAVSEAQARASLAYLGTLLGESPPDDPLVPALKDTFERYRLRREPFDELLCGMEMDLVKKRYASFEELHLYCYRVASVIGLVCIEIFGHEISGQEISGQKGGSAPELAVKLGVAMQLTNIIRDIKEDEARGRIYLPADEMERFAYTPQDLAQGVVNDRFRALLSFQVNRARSYFQAAEPLFSLIRAESRYCPILLKRFYLKILRSIEERGYDVLHRRPSLAWHEKIRLAGSLWLQARGFRRPSRRKSRSSRGA